MDRDPQRESEIQELCKQVLEIGADCYEGGGGAGYTRCPLCLEEERKWQGGMHDITHSPNCGWLIAKGLSTGA
jgi:hypothetical protein